MYDLAQDHQSLKMQIKEWEKILDKLYDELNDNRLTWKTRREEVGEELNRISDEMMAINI